MFLIKKYLTSLTDFLDLSIHAKPFTKFYVYFFVLQTNDIAVLQKTSKGWVMLETAYKFTKTTVTFDTKELSRYMQLINLARNYLDRGLCFIEFNKLVKENKT